MAKRESSYRQIAKRVRARLFDEQNGLCYYCNVPMLLDGPRIDNRLAPQQVTLDHIKPLANGGRRAPTLNTVAACHACNNQRGSTDAEKFKRRKQGG